MRVDRSRHIRLAGLHVGHELEQRRLVEAFRKTFSVHDVTGFELHIRQQKSIRRHQIDTRMIRPAGEERPQDAGRGALADCHAARHADDERHLVLAPAEELGGVGMEGLRGMDVKVQEPGHRQINVHNLLRRDALIHARELQEVVVGQRHRRVSAQLRPLFAGKHAVGRDVGARSVGVVQGVQHQRAYSLFPGREAFSSRPERVMRASSASSTSAMAMPRNSSSTRRW